MATTGIKKIILVNSIQHILTECPGAGSRDKCWRNGVTQTGWSPGPQDQYQVVEDYHDGRSVRVL